MKKLAIAAAFVGTVYCANWALTHWGTVPVWPGLEAPAGVYFAGIGFLLRDWLHEVAGRLWVVGAIVAGAALSYLIDASITLPGAVTSIAVASGVAFLASETADLACYSPLRERNLPLAVGASQIVGAFADSLLFLWLAGLLSWNLFAGQMVGKTLVMLPAVAFLFFAKARVRVDVGTA